MDRVVLGRTPPSIEEIDRIASGAKVVLDSDALQRMDTTRVALERVEASGEPIYGVNTGFGPLKSVLIPEEDRIRLQENLIRSHSAGAGDPLPRVCVRAAMAVLAASLLKGHSGVPSSVAALIGERLNRDDIPVIPSQGSLGASGDLAPLAHIALAMMESGDLDTASKVGLSLINGTHVHTALAALLVLEAERLAYAADVACAMIVEALLCSGKPFEARVHALRPHKHQANSARNISKLVSGSQLMASHANCGEVQDAYSIRCAPQVHGAARQAIAHLRDVVEVELSSVTDNPLLIDEEVISAGHFHGEPVGLALDYAKIGIAELASISERRTERALNKDLNRGLPAFLVATPGLNSGLMILQYTAAALVSENKVLAHPSCVDSIPTGANQEDHVSMAMNAALHARKVLANARRVIAIEMLVAAQALDCRRALQPERPGQGVRAAWEAVRKHSKHVSVDRSLASDIESLDVFAVAEAAFLAASQQAGRN
jgi:histidine ammonia-lyase